MTDKEKDFYIRKLEYFTCASCHNLGMPLLDNFLNGKEEIPVETKILVLDFALNLLSRRYQEKTKISNRL